MIEEKAPDCYKCRWRGVLSFSCHSKCQHPKAQQGHDDLSSTLRTILGSKHPSVENKLGVRGKSHGIKHGWFAWPHNFDPVWLLSCNGFEERE